MKTIWEDVARHEKEWQEWRRDLHMHPELGWMEMRTAAFIAKKLKDFGWDEVLVGEEVCAKEGRMGVPGKATLQAAYERAKAEGSDPAILEKVKDGCTGVMGILRCGEGPVVALRFDMDALPVKEEQGVGHEPYEKGFPSIHDGVMHACGHDGHVTIGLGVAQLLVQRRQELYGTVKLIFQPAEEGVRGARAIVEAGHLDEVSYLLGGHIFRNQGKEMPFAVGIGENHTMATTKLDVTFHGLASHAAASPEQGKNAMLAAATSVLNLYAIPRHGTASTMINVGTIHGGSGRNVVCDTAVMEVEVRGTTTEGNEYMEAYARRIVEHSAAMHDCTCEIQVVGGTVSNRNSVEWKPFLMELCETQLGVPWTDQLEMGGSEDYALMAHRVQERGGKSYYLLLITTCAAALHNGCFTFDETVLPKGVAVFTSAVHTLLKKND